MVVATRTLRIAGRFVAFDSGGYDKNEPLIYLSVIDALSGKRVQAGEALAGGEEPPDGRADKGITDIELRPNGSVAWIVQNPFRSPPLYEVNIIGKDVRNADLGDDIEPRSLALSGSTLYWTRGGVPRSTALR